MQHRLILVVLAKVSEFVDALEGGLLRKLVLTHECKEEAICLVVLGVLMGGIDRVPGGVLSSGFRSNGLSIQVGIVQHVDLPGEALEAQVLLVGTLVVVREFPTLGFQVGLEFGALPAAAGVLFPAVQTSIKGGVWTGQLLATLGWWADLVALPSSSSSTCTLESSDT